MPTIEEKLRFCAVKVNEGSGCIFQPNTDEFTYILSVKHNIEKEDKSICLPAEVRILRNNLDEAPISVLAVHIHDRLDLAVIVVDYLGSSGFDMFTSKPSRNEELLIFGYPDYLKNTQKKTTDILCKCGLEQESNVSYEIISDAQLYTFNQDAAQNVIGLSGSGIFRIDGDNLILKGIFPRLNDPEGAHNKVNGFHICPINELLKKEGLLELFPMHLSNFKFLRAEAFKFDLSIFQKEKLESTINYLKNKALDVISSGVTPVAIKSFFNYRLLVDERERDVLTEKKIWGTWLEFLTVMNIIKYQKFDETEIFEIFNSFRLKYSNTDKDWTYLLKEHLLYSDYHGLKKGGKVFIQTQSPSSATGELLIPKDKIREITRVYDPEKFKTDSGSHPYTDYDFIHVDYLKKECIVKKLETYEVLANNNEILEALKIEYNELFS